MASIFSKIISREIPAYIIAENEEFIAFLDVMPLAKGHVLVVPKVEMDYIFDMQDDMLSALMLFAKQVALKLERAITCKRIGVAVIGLEVPHTHIHLLPMNSVGDINFEKPKLALSKDEMEEIAQKIALA